MEITYFAIIIGAIFVNNVVLAQFLGICPFLGVSSKVETSMGMGAAVTFVMALSGVVAWLIQNYILVPLGIEYMQTIVFILVIAALVQMVEIVLMITFAGLLTRSSLMRIILISVRWLQRETCIRIRNVRILSFCHMVWSIREQRCCPLLQNIHISGSDFLMAGLCRPTLLALIMLTM